MQSGKSAVRALLSDRAEAPARRRRRRPRLPLSTEYRHSADDMPQNLSSPNSADRRAEDPAPAVVPRRQRCIAHSAQTPASPMPTLRSADKEYCRLSQRIYRLSDAPAQSRRKTESAYGAGLSKPARAESVHKSSALRHSVPAGKGYRRATWRGKADWRREMQSRNPAKSSPQGPASAREPMHPADAHRHPAYSPDCRLFWRLPDICRKNLRQRHNLSRQKHGRRLSCPATRFP